MNGLIKVCGVVGVLALAFVFKTQAFSAAEDWMKEKALRVMLQEMRSEMTSSDAEIEQMILELQSQQDLGIEEKTLVRELQIILRQREILRLASPLEI